MYKRNFWPALRICLQINNVCLQPYKTYRKRVRPVVFSANCQIRNCHSLQNLATNRLKIRPLSSYLLDHRPSLSSSPVCASMTVKDYNRKKQLKELFLRNRNKKKTDTLKRISPDNIFIFIENLSMLLSCLWRVSQPSKSAFLLVSPAPANSAKLRSTKPSFVKERPPLHSFRTEIRSTHRSRTPVDAFANILHGKEK